MKFSSDEIASVLQQEIEQFDSKIDVREVGTVLEVGDGIARVYGLSGVMAAPLLSVEQGMGEDMLILSFVVIVIGGIGSIRGAFVASIVVGIVETLGRSIIPFLLEQVISNEAAQTAGPAIASMSIYLLMAAVLFFRPQGLFPARGG